MLALAKQVVLTNTKNKVQLNAMLAERNCPIPDTVIYDVPGQLTNSVCTRTTLSSIKAFTRMHRGGSTRVFNLTPEMLAPAKQVVLTNTKNKV